LATRYNQGRIYRHEPQGAQAPMASFDDREKGYESKFAHDQEIAFKARARRDSLIARWLAPQLKLSAVETEEYRKSLAGHAHEKNHDDALVKRIMADSAAKGVAMTEHRLRRHLSELLEEAHKQVTEETKR
jgi:hypothetical protein